MSESRAGFPVATMARVLGVSTSGYHAWAKHRPARRARSDASLIGRISAIHAASHGTYGAPRIHAELAAEGVAVGRKRVARLMRSAGMPAPGHPDQSFRLIPIRHSRAVRSRVPNEPDQPFQVIPISVGRGVDSVDGRDGARW